MKLGSRIRQILSRTIRYPVSHGVFATTAAAETAALPMAAATGNAVITAAATFNPGVGKMAAAKALPKIAKAERKFMPKKAQVKLARWRRQFLSNKGNSTLSRAGNKVEQVGNKVQEGAEQVGRNTRENLERSLGQQYNTPYQIVFSNKNNMIKFRQKEYTIQSGKYDGPKDLEKVPSALSVIGKTALAGAGIGGVVGYSVDKLDRTQNTGFWDGSKTGYKAGFFAGIGLKMLINSIHKPMSAVKYQEVDKQIRKQFGIYRMSGITVGDTIEKRDKLDEKYSFNDQNILSYKINIAIQDGKFTMYILKLTDKELEDLNKILDYYCKKYFGMNYTSTIIGNKSDNSYSIQIIFTNYDIIVNFLSEISDKLMCKINLLNNKAIIETKTSEEKTFGIPSMDKTEILEFFTKNGLGSIQKFFMGAKLKGLSEIIMYTLVDTIGRLTINEQQKIMPVLKDDLNNKFLETAFENSGLIEGMHYTIDKKDCPLNMYLSKGTLIISSLSSSPEGKKMEKIYSQQQKEFYNKTLVNKGQVIVYTYGVTNKNKLTLLLKKMVASGIKPNVLVL